jgi:hypothetical protein
VKTPDGYENVCKNMPECLFYGKPTFVDVFAFSFKLMFNLPMCEQHFIETKVEERSKLVNKK